MMHDPWYRTGYVIGRAVAAVAIVAAILIGAPVLIIHIINANK